MEHNNEQREAIELIASAIVDTAPVAVDRSKLPSAWTVSLNLISDPDRDPEHHWGWELDLRHTALDYVRNIQWGYTSHAATAYEQAMQALQEHVQTLQGGDLPPDAPVDPHYPDC